MPTGRNTQQTAQLNVPAARRPNSWRRAYDNEERALQNLLEIYTGTSHVKKTCQGKLARVEL